MSSQKLLVYKYSNNVTYDFNTQMWFKYSKFLMWKKDRIKKCVHLDDIQTVEHVVSEYPKQS